MNGTFGTWTARASCAPVADPGSLVGSGRVVLIAPHPDDETIACSALLLDAAASGRAITIVALTDGDASHPGSKSFPPAELAAIRIREQEAAVAALGCTQVEWLRLALPDGASPWHPGRTEATTALEDYCRNRGVSAVVAPHPDDPHPDHHTAAEMALHLRSALPSLRVLFYEVWTCSFADDVPLRQNDLTPFRLSTDRRAKARAIACHASQLGEIVPDCPDGFTLPDWFLKHHDAEHERISWLNMPGSLPGAEHFDELYSRLGDPWNVRTSPYEVSKRAAAMTLLSQRKFQHALEAGCGEGCLSADLVREGQVARATGMDRSDVVINRARSRAPVNVGFVSGMLPSDIPEGPFDLILFSEVLYFLDEPDLEDLAQKLPGILMPNAEILIVSYLGATDTPLDGVAAADFLIACLGERATPLARRNGEGFRLDLLRWRA